MSTTDLLRLIDDAAQAGPGRTALQCHDGTMTYEQLLQASASIARALTSTGARPERVAVLAGDDLQTYCALLGVWMAGAAYVPLSTGNPVQRNVEILDDAGVSAVIGSRPHEPAAEACGILGKPWIDTQEAVQCFDARGRNCISSSDQLAYILYTSGTTGRPKGVPIYHRNLNAFRDAWLSTPLYRLNADDRFLQMFPLGFDLSVMNIFVPWTLGASVHAVPRAGPAYLNIYKILQEQALTVAMMVPSVLSYLARHMDEISLPELRYNLFCGEALPHELTRRWSYCVPNAVIENTYGPTEATIFCHSYLWQPERSARESVNDIVPIGRPIAGMNGVILDKSGAPVPRGQIGELCLLGPQLTDGYWRRPERTASAFFSFLQDGKLQRAYRSGDLASELQDGTVVWRGRIDHQVKIDGQRIELGEIEAHARALSDSVAAAAVVTVSEPGLHRITLFLEGGQANLQVLAERLATRLPDYMRPSHIRRLDALPLNDNGKIDRRRLAELPSG